MGGLLPLLAIVVLLQGFCVQAKPAFAALPEGGFIRGESDPVANNWESFKGLRYAEPPTGFNRFQPPVIYPLPVEDTLAQTFGPECLQAQKSDPQGPVRSEDCEFFVFFAP
jgi:carboxylesterase type B